MRGPRRWWRSRTRKLFRSFEIWVFARLAERREILGVPVSAWSGDDPVFDKIEAAFQLLLFYGQRTLAGLRKDTVGVWVQETHVGLGEWQRDVRIVVLDEDYVRDPQTTPMYIASTLVHEVTHARLERMGFEYVPERRERIEKACFRRELAFARRLPPGAETLIAEAQRQLARPPDYLTPEWRRARRLQKLDGQIEKLRDLGVPRWVLGLLERLARWRLSESSSP